MTALFNSHQSSSLWLELIRLGRYNGLILSLSTLHRAVWIQAMPAVTVWFSWEAHLTLTMLLLDFLKVLLNAQVFKW